MQDRRDTYVGQQVTILDNRGICQHSGYCTDRLATAFRAGEEPFVAPSGGRMDELIRAVRDCPSGALSYALDGVEAREGGRITAPVRRRSRFPRTGPSGHRRDRAGRRRRRRRTPNAGASLEHYALCRCGHSQNKPFCSGMHWYVDFKDPVQGPDQEPTIFEWAGGLPALTRMTRLFYEKYVPQDPLRPRCSRTCRPTTPSASPSGWGRCSAAPRLQRAVRRLHADDLPASGQGPHRGQAGTVGAADPPLRPGSRPARRRRVPLSLQLLHRMGFEAGA